MKEVNTELLKEVLEDRLKESLSMETTSNESKQAIKDAMDVADRLIEVEKTKLQHQEQLEKQKQEEIKLKQEEERKKKELKSNIILKAVEIGAMVLVAPLVQYGCNRGYVKLVGLFEKDDYYRTTAGKSLSSLFRLKGK